MATILDIGLLQQFRVIFPFLLVLVLVYAILSLSILKERRAISAFVAFLLAAMTLFSDIVVETINRMTPALVILFVAMIFALIAFGLLGVDPHNVLGMEYGKHVGWWLFAIMLVIFIGSLTSVLSEHGGVPGPEATGPITGGNVTLTGPEGAGQQGVFFKTVFNPKVLGMILVLIIAMIAIQRLTIAEGSGGGGGGGHH